MRKLADSPTFKALKNRVNALEAQPPGATEWGEVRNRPQKFLTDYADFDAALKAIGTTEATDLIVNAPVSITANKVVPSNVKLVQRGTGIFTVVAAATLTIGAMQDPGNRQFFAGAGKKLFTRGAVQFYNLQWWMPQIEYSDITGAFNDAYESCYNGGGGLVVIPTGNWLTSGEHKVPSFTTTTGVGGSRIFPPSDNTTIFRISGIGGAHSINFDNFVINGYYRNVIKTGVRGIVGNADGGQIYSLSCKRLRFEVFETAFHHEAKANGEGICWEFEDCITGDGKTAFRCDSINSSQLFTNCRFHVTTGGTIFDLKHTGGFEAKNCLFISVPNQKEAGGLPDSKATVLKVFGAHNIIKFTNCQDEALQYFLQTDVNNDRKGLIVLEGNLIQCLFEPTADCTIFSRNNLYVWGPEGNFKGTAPGRILGLYSENDTFDNRNTSGVTVGDKVGIFTAPSYVVRQQQFGYTQFLQKLEKTAGEPDAATPPFADGLRPALEALTEVNTDTHPGVNHPFFRMGVKAPNGNVFGWQFKRDPATGNMIVSSNMPGFDTIQFRVDGIALKAPNGQMRKLVLNSDGTVTSVAV